MCTMYVSGCVLCVWGCMCATGSLEIFEGLIFTYWCLKVQESPPRNSMGIVHAGGTCSFVDGPATKFLLLKFFQLYVMHVYVYSYC